MSGDGEILTEVVEGALVVPETALRYQGDHIFVDVANGEGFVERTVIIGIVDGDRVQVQSGLEPGEEVRLQ
jgi:multidrug efflux pump subunit AcrA (membrane-fusion protein)